MKKNLLFILGLLLCSMLAQAQKNVTGKVTGDDGTPLPGVNVRLKNSPTGVSTDAKGLYSIKTSPQDILLFSSVGYVSQEVKVGNRTEINLAMASGTSSLDEVVVIGYGTQQRLH